MFGFQAGLFPGDNQSVLHDKQHDVQAGQQRHAGGPDQPDADEEVAHVDRIAGAGEGTASDQGVHVAAPGATHRTDVGDSPPADALPHRRDDDPREDRLPAGTTHHDAGQQQRYGRDSAPAEEEFTG